MKLFLKILAGVVACLVVVLVAANFLIPASVIKDQVVARIGDATGRKLTVGGDSTLSFLPNPHLVLNDVSITDPNAKQTAIDVQLQRLEVNLSLLALLSMKVDVSSVLLDKPLIVIQPPGVAGLPGQRASLDAPANMPIKPKPVRFAADGAGFKPGHYIAAQAAGGLSYDIQLKDVRINDGTVRILDAKGTATREIAHITAALVMPHINQPLHAKGSFDLMQQPINFDVALTSLAALQNRQPADVQLSLASRLFNASFQGKLATAPAMTASGVVKGDTDSFKALLNWRPQRAKHGKPMEAALVGRLQYTPEQVTLDNTRFLLGQSKGQGRFAVSLSTPKPHLRGAIAIDLLDLTPFLTQDKTQASSAAARRQSGGGQGSSNGPAQPQAGQPSSSQAQTSQSGQGSSQTQASSGAAAVDADVNINVNQTKINKITLGPSAVNLALHNGVLTANLAGMKLYDGEGRGKFIVDLARSVPSFKGNLTLDRVSAKPLLSDASGFELLSGKIKLAMNLTGKGASADAIKSSLNGKGNVAVSDGAISGIDLTQVVTTFDKGELPEIDGGETKFSSLGGSFTIKNGIAETKDMQMTSDLVAVSAAGKVNIPDSTIDMLAKPRVLKQAKGKKNANDLAGMTVPIRIQGPLSRPTYQPEVGALLNDPKSANKALNKLGEALEKKYKGKPVGEAIGRFLGQIEVQGRSKSK